MGLEVEFYRRRGNVAPGISRWVFDLIELWTAVKDGVCSAARRELLEPRKIQLFLIKFCRSGDLKLTFMFLL